MKRHLLSFAFVALFALPLAVAAERSTAKPEKPLHISQGEKIQLADYIVAGKTTIFDFYSEYCPPCVRVAPALERLHRERDDIVVVKVDINRPRHRGIDWKSPVALQYRLRAVPHFKVFGPDGKLIAEDRAGAELVYGWLD